jgi:hypothetical protein
LSRRQSPETFACLVSRDENERIDRLTVHASGPDGLRRTAVAGHAAQRIAAQFHEILRQSAVTARQWNSSIEIKLDSVTGAQLELMLMAIKPVVRAGNMDLIAHGVSGMSREEASYWHAKSTQKGGLPALRILLTGGRDR